MDQEIQQETSSHNPSPKNKVRQVLELFQGQSLFSKLSILFLAIIILLTPTIIAGRQILNSHASNGLPSTCIQPPSCVTQRTCPNIASAPGVNWCGYQVSDLKNLTWGKSGIAYASSGNASDANLNFANLWTAQETLPAIPNSTSPYSWLAYNLTNIQHKNILLVWYNDLGDASPYDHTLVAFPRRKAENLPMVYTIEGSKTPGIINGQPPKDWQTLLTVTNNHLHSRQYLLTINGYNWVRIKITAIDPISDLGSTHASLHMDLYDAGEATNDLPDDFFLIDDSTGVLAIGQHQFPGTSVQELLGQKLGRVPVFENGSVGGLRAKDLINPSILGIHFDNWIARFHGKYIPLVLGVNDVLQDWNNNCGVTDQNYASYAKVIQMILDSGKTPIVSYINWGPDKYLSMCADKYNHGIVDKIYQQFSVSILKGPDLYQLTFNHNGYFTTVKNEKGIMSFDGIHPRTPAATLAIRQAWASTIFSKIYNAGEPVLPTSVQTTPNSVSITPIFNKPSSTNGGTILSTPTPQTSCTPQPVCLKANPPCEVDLPNMCPN